MENPIHTTDEVLALASKDALSDELRRLSIKHRSQDVLALSDLYKAEIQYELDKYKSMIGIRVSYVSWVSKTRKTGIIESFLHFAGKQVVFRIRYDNGGQDSVYLGDVTNISNEIINKF